MHNAQTEQNTLLVLRHAKGAIPANLFSAKGPEDIVKIGQWLEGVAAGVQNGSAWVDIHRGSTDARPALANQTLAFATSSGTVGIVVNGVTITVTWGTSDILSMSALVAAINASSNALVAGLLAATNLSATITLASTAEGDWVEIQPVGYQPVRFTASANPGGLEQFSQAGSDTADAAALVVKINAHPAFMGRLLATSSAGVVTLWQLVPGTTAGYRLQKSGSPITLSSAVLTAAATCLVFALQRGKLGNCITTAATGTNVTAGGARMTGGVGGDAATPVRLRR